MNTAQIKALLRERFKAPEHALMFEVGNGTGFEVKRHADAVVMNLWPSRGLSVWGFEIKAHRSDWLKELRNPAKAEEIACYCDRWYVVAPENVVGTHELPESWGLFLATPKGLRLAIEAKPRAEPKQLTRAFVAAMLRRASEADEDVIKAAVERRLEPLRKQAEENATRQQLRNDEELKALRAQCAELSAVLGQPINRYTDTRELATAIRIVQTIGIDSAFGLAGTVSRLAKELDKAIAQLHEAKRATQPEKAPS